MKSETLLNESKGFGLAFQPPFAPVRRGTSLETNDTDEPTTFSLVDIRASEQHARLICVHTLACEGKRGGSGNGNGVSGDVSASRLVSYAD